MSQLNRWTIPQLWDFATGFGGFVFFLGGGGIEVTEELCIICTSYSLPEWQAITNILAP